jgi:hypothetical protein
MNRDDIIKLARWAGFAVGRGSPALDKFERLLAVVVRVTAEAEREACARVCEQWDASHPQRLAAAIRARGQQAEEDNPSF